ncbi:MAG: AzlC family ABC transporter permease [Xanthobacteraceae bacterium]
MADGAHVPSSSGAAFFAGFRAAWGSALAYVLIGTYLGIAALAHDFGFSLGWMLSSTFLVWMGPAQVLLISALGAGATPFETAIAVWLSGARILPMIISLLPLAKSSDTRRAALVLPAQLTAVSLWIEAMRLLPAIPREKRVNFTNGLGIGFMAAAQLGTLAGYYLATSLPAMLTAALLFLTPMSFLISTTRNCRGLADWLALALGLILAPLLTWWEIGLDLLWTGMVGGTLAYLVHRLPKRVM